MATRLYLANVAPDYAPTTIRGNWLTTNESSGAHAMPLSPEGASTSQYSSHGGSNAAEREALNGRWVSPPLSQTGSLSGSLTLCAGWAPESSFFSSYMRPNAMHAYVTAGDTESVRGTLVSNFQTNYTLSSATFLGYQDAVGVTTVSYQEGDRIVIEIGWTATVDTSDGGCLLHYGGTGADLFDGDSDSSHSAWIEVEADDLFATPGGSNVDNFFSFF